MVGVEDEVRSLSVLNDSILKTVLCSFKLIICNPSQFFSNLNHPCLVLVYYYLLDAVLSINYFGVFYDF